MVIGLGNLLGLGRGFTLAGDELGKKPPGLKSNAPDLVRAHAQQGGVLATHLLIIQ